MILIKPHSIDDFSYRLNFDLEKREKEHVEISKIAKFDQKMWKI
jgi:hypothetical protein